MWLGCYWSVKFIYSKLSFSIYELVGFELECVVVTGLVPTHHWWIVSFSCAMLIGPIILFGLVASYIFCFFCILQLKGILKICQFIAMIIVSSFFFNAKILCFWKRKQLCLIWLFIHEQMRKFGNFLCLEVYI